MWRRQKRGEGQTREENESSSQPRFSLRCVGRARTSPSRKDTFYADFRGSPSPTGHFRPNASDCARSCTAVINR